MNSFIPFIHKNERKKKEDDLQPLYIELYPPMEKIQKEEEKKDDVERGVVIIEL